MRDRGKPDSQQQRPYLDNICEYTDLFVRSSASLRCQSTGEQQLAQNSDLRAYAGLSPKMSNSDMESRFCLDDSTKFQLILSSEVERGAQVTIESSMHGGQNFSRDTRTISQFIQQRYNQASSLNLQKLKRGTHNALRPANCSPSTARITASSPAMILGTLPVSGSYTKPSAVEGSSSNSPRD